MTVPRARRLNEMQAALVRIYHDVEDRSVDEKAVSMDDIADAAGVPRGWTSNALHSSFVFRDLFGSKFNAYPVASERIDTVIIPPTFGHDYIQYDELTGRRKKKKRRR